MTKIRNKDTIEMETKYDLHCGLCDYRMNSGRGKCFCAISGEVIREPSICDDFEYNCDEISEIKESGFRYEE